MPLAIGQMQVGACVEDVFNEDGTRKRVRRRGFIVRVEYPGAAAWSGSGVDKIWVQFDRDKPAEDIRPCCLALVRSYDSVEAGRVRQEEENRVSDGMVKDRRAPLSDRTGVNTKEPLSEHSMEKHGLKKIQS